jgi:hypothetical protein
LAIRTNELTILKGSEVEDSGEYLSISRGRGRSKRNKERSNSRGNDKHMISRLLSCLLFYAHQTHDMLTGILSLSYLILILFYILSCLYHTLRIKQTLNVQGICIICIKMFDTFEFLLQDERYKSHLFLQRVES